MGSKHRMRALVDLSRTLSASLDLKEVLRSLTEHATGLTGASATAVSLWDRERDVLVTLTDFRNNVVGEIGQAELEYVLDDFPASRAVMEQRRHVVVRVDDEKADLSEREMLDADGYGTL